MNHIDVMNNTVSVIVRAVNVGIAAVVALDDVHGSVIVGICLHVVTRPIWRHVRGQHISRKAIHEIIVDVTARISDLHTFARIGCTHTLVLIGDLTIWLLHTILLSVWLLMTSRERDRCETDEHKTIHT